MSTVKATDRSGWIVLAALVVGWVLVTWGVAAWLGRWPVWPISGGVLLLLYAVPAALTLARRRVLEGEHD